MRRVSVIVGLGLVLAIGGYLAFRAFEGPGDGGGSTVAPADGKAKEPEFAPVEVRSTGSGGLTLSGTVRDPQGTPIAGAEVSIAASGQQSLVSVRCATCGELLMSCHGPTTQQLIEGLLADHKGELVPGATTRTDAEGKFRFESIMGISFTVWANAPGLGTGVKERAAPGDPVDLFLPALRSITGRLRDEEGQPVQGRVWAVSRRLARPVSVTADAAGRFQITGLGEGPFYVLATAPGRLPSEREQVEAGPEPVTLTLQAPRTLEVRLVSQGQPIAGVVRLSGDHLTREQVAKGGLAQITPLYPGRLMVSAVSGELSSAPQSVSLDSLLTQVTLTLDKGGTLAVSVLDETEQPVPSPTVELLATSGELIATRKLGTGDLGVLGPYGAGDYLVRASAEGFNAATMPVTVKAGETRVDVSLQKGTLISGKVIDEYGRAAPGVSVLVTPTGDNVLSDAEGKFRAPVPSPGLYSLHAHHSDWGGGEVKVQAPKADVVLQLEARAGAAVTVSLEGRRVEGASVILFHSKGNFRSDRPSGADGVVMMRGLPPDSYTLVATHPDFLPSERQTLKLEEGQLLQVTAELKSGAPVKGQVVDAQGLPVPNVMVAVQPRGAEPVATDTSGNFSVGPLRPKGMYAVVVLQRGLEQADRVIATAGGDAVKVTVKRLPTFTGRVLGEGTPLQHFRVDEHEVTTPDGRFDVSLPASAERVIVSIEAPGYEPLVVDRPRAPDLGDFDLKRAPQVTGVVREEGGGVVPDAVVGCDSCEGSVLSGPDGRFTLSKPPFQREFNVTAKKGRRTATRSVTSDVTAGVELVLKPGTVVSGSAWLAPGKPAAGVEIAGISADRSETTTVVTNEDGSFTMDLAPGIYSFMVAAPELMNASTDPPALITEVKGTAMRLDFGPAPGLASLAVRITPRPGYALWLVRGALTSVGSPPMELLRASWAQLIFQPRVPQVVFTGLQPGHYTLVWANFHGGGPDEPPTLVPVDVPAQGEVSLVR